MRALRLLLLLLLALTVACVPTRRGGNRGGSGDDDDDSASDDDDSVGDDDDSVGDDDDLVGDDDDSVDPDTLEGNTWSLDLLNATWVEPAGIGSILTGFGTAMGVSVLTSSDLGSGDIDLRFGALTTVLDQDPCIATSDLGGDWSNPWAAAEGTLPISSLTLDPGTLELRFEDGAIADGIILGSADVRGLESIVGQDPDSMCELFSSFGVSCEGCPSDGQPYCFFVHVEDITGSPLGAFVLDSRSAGAIASDPSCN